MLLMAPLNEVTMESYLKDYHCGSLIVWGNITPIRDVRELCALTNKAQTLSLKHRSLPVWLHGFIPGLGWEYDWARNAAQRSVGVEDVQQAAAIFGRRWRAVGLHNLPQPCLNVLMYPTGIMPDWAMSSDPDVVSRYGLALTKGILSARCGTMAQHFPAHGATALDSHNAFPVVDLPWEELWRDHLACYQACFDAGCTSLCTAHLACLAIDPDPRQMATTSRVVLTDFLRGKMRFRGITIADSVNMYGFQKNGPPEQVAIDAVIAGCDSICVTNAASVEPVYTNLLNAARQRRITPERLDEAVTRNLSFMAWLGLFKEQIVSAEDAIKLLQNDADSDFLKEVTGKLNQ
jgi:beta-glucosidase-like glycosyl hydrolase